MVLLAMLSDAAFHSTLLKALAVSRVDGLGFDEGEIKDGGRHIVGRLDRVGGKGRFGAVVVNVKASDAMMVIVVGEEFTKFFRVIFDEKACNYNQLVGSLNPGEGESRRAVFARPPLLTDRKVIIGVSWWCRWRDLYTIEHGILGRKSIIGLLRTFKVVALTRLVKDS